MGDNFEPILLAIMAALEIVLILRLRSKLRTERDHADNCEKMTAVVKSASWKRDTPRSIMYSFTVKADNGFTYDLRSYNARASMIKEGDSVEILVPDGAPARSEEDEYYEEICRRGKEALKELSEAEKKRLNDYLTRKTDDILVYTKAGDIPKFPSLVLDGGGLKSEILPLAILIAVFAVIIVAAAVLMFMNR